MPYRRALLINSGRQPFELVILAVCVLSGLSGLLVPGAQSPAIVAALGEWTWAWYVGLTLGGAVPLVGVWLKMPTCLLIERVGMVWLSTLFLAYGVGIAFVADSRGVTAAAFTAGYGLAAAARVWQISRDLRKLKAAISAPSVATEPVLGDPKDDGPAP